MHPQIHWLNQVSADFNAAADWPNGVVPVAGSAAILDAVGSTDYTVTVSTDEKVNNVQLASTATLAITQGVFRANGGTGAGVNAGTISIANGSTLITSGDFANTGTIAVGTTGAGVLLFDANAILTGGGTVSLSGDRDNRITGTDGHKRRGENVVLTNADNTIVGSGHIGDSKHLTLVNHAAGVIDADSAVPLDIRTGSRPIVNAGLIEATGAGRCVIESVVDNTGTLEVDGGTLALLQSVTGSGALVIAAGTLYLGAGSAENLSFTGGGGVFKLGASQSYTGTITGFSTTGGTSLDLIDIGFVSAGEATFSGTSTSGVLTVTDGVHTSRVTLIGDYLSSTFVASSGRGGGTIVVAEATPTPAVHRFIAAAAAMGGSAGEALHGGAAWHNPAPMLARPHGALA